MPKELIFAPHELRTIEVDVEKKIFKVNGEDFGHGCRYFSISCDAEEGYKVRMEIDTKVILASYDGIGRTSVSEHPAWRLRQTGGQECSNQSE